MSARQISKPQLSSTKLPLDKIFLILSFRCIGFEPTNASYVLSGSNDTLRVHSWEPVQLLDTVQTNWKNVVDMTIHKDQLVCLRIEIAKHFLCFF